MKHREVQVATFEQDVAGFSSTGYCETSLLLSGCQGAPINDPVRLYAWGEEIGAELDALDRWRKQVKAMRP